MPPRSPQEMMAAVAANLQQRTGRSLPEWVELVNASGIDALDQKAVRNWLKTQHGVPQNSQWEIAETAACAAGWVRPSVEGYIDSQYTGPKAHLRPLFDRLREIIEALGDDVRAEGRSTYTPFVRRRQFAAVAAASRVRLEVGLRYTNPPASPRLSPAKAPGQATHKLSVSSLEEIDEEVAALLRESYEQNG